MQLTDESSEACGQYSAVYANWFVGQSAPECQVNQDTCHCYDATFAQAIVDVAYGSLCGDGDNYKDTIIYYNDLCRASVSLL